ncbi:MAG: hypothetical protein FWC91_00830 [Defluviitaleaceae bacterium]|nr:hypothetical protein [Defluviitaleaceae bacterium]
MSGLHHSVTMAFGLSGTVREKGYYKTTDGMRIIRKTKDGRSQILAWHQIKEHCNTSGYPWMDRYHLTNSGNPYAFADGEHYVMTDNFHNREVDFTDNQEFLKIVKAIAHWHSCARGISFSNEASLNKNQLLEPLTEIFKAEGKALDIIRKRIRKQSQLSDFDVLFVKHYPNYRERVQKAHQLLESTGYLKRFNQAHKMSHICHGNLKEDYLYLHGDQVYITKLNHATLDYQLNDLCSLIRRREKKRRHQKDQKELSHNIILEAYSQVMPLETDEEVILEAILLYPSTFIKIVTEYYKKKRSWTPVSMANKMQEVLKLDESFT